MAKIKKCKYKIERKNGINPSKDYFWLQDSKDKRNKSWTKQRKKYGFDNRELWNLDFVILAFI